jgi:sterol 3beta-glucosyltransferase
MKITLLTAGSRGDVQPYIALARGLSGGGHRVRLASYSSFEEMASRYGLEFAPIHAPPEAITNSRRWYNWQRSGSDLPRLIYYYSQITREAQASITMMLDDYWLACQDADLVISSASGFIGPQIAEARQALHCWALFQPMTPSRAFPVFFTPGMPSLGGKFNAISYRIAEQIYWWLFKASINRWRQSRLRLPPSRQPLQSMFSNSPEARVLYGFSSQVIPKPDDWGENISVCGYWFLEPPADWRPCQELVQFLEAGEHPVYIGVTNIRSTSSQAMMKLALEALRICGYRAILNTAGLEFEPAAIPDTVFCVDSVPHDWLFPRVAAVVHHGGAGTTASAFRAGVPSLGIPGFFDQPFWSQLIPKLGVGLPPISPKRLTARRLAMALTQLVTDPAIKLRSIRLGEAIRKELGVQRAVAEVGGFATKGFQEVSGYGFSNQTVFRRAKDAKSLRNPHC